MRTRANGSRRSNARSSSSMKSTESTRPSPKALAPPAAVSPSHTFVLFAFSPCFPPRTESVYLARRSNLLPWRPNAASQNLQLHRPPPLVLVTPLNSPILRTAGPSPLLTISTLLRAISLSIWVSSCGKESRRSLSRPSARSEGMQRRRSSVKEVVLGRRR